MRRGGPCPPFSACLLAALELVLSVLRWDSESLREWMIIAISVLLRFDALPASSAGLFPDLVKTVFVGVWTTPGVDAEERVGLGASVAGVLAVGVLAEGVLTICVRATGAVAGTTLPTGLELCSIASQSIEEMSPLTLVYFNLAVLLTCLTWSFKGFGNLTFAGSLRPPVVPEALITSEAMVFGLYFKPPENDLRGGLEADGDDGPG